tara:strand:- start:53 stop:589 length:537 start_codon:yes stop_codon:yes gene_type:complete
MANVIKDTGVWGPIEEGVNAGGFPIRSYEGKQIVLDFDNSDATSTLYTGLLETPIVSQSQFVWNTEAVDCADAADVQIFWQGTDDPSIAKGANYGGSDQQGVSGLDTGWESVEIMDLNASAKCDARTSVVLDGVSGVLNKSYSRIKFILTAANPGDVDITCRYVNLASINSTLSTTAS